ncbi:hypothetical protein [Paenibacillus segetis]|uniref:LexA repressor DNA-binding domain-containing protein n=1 Tax=Paenibacillus segetis TaxID=1325360 RepID=A0ABQ1Y964_9BACL|nr:hypothetical protein [Paenibacillus segetis]GGH17156.1 hypothetical protein GCM10008013_12350 [Paenibacillus segetis]
MNNKPLTHRQSEALEFIKSYVANNGYPPTIRETPDYLKLSSSSTAFKIVEQLVRKGFIKKGSGPREIQIVGYEDVRDKQITRLQQQLKSVNEAIDEGPQFGITAWDWQDWLYFTLPFLKEPLVEGDKE